MKLHIWDTVGQEQFESMTKGYFQSSALAIVTFDVTEKKSFEDVEKWMDMIRNNSINEIPIFIAGNKTDLIEKRAVSEAEGMELAESEPGASYFEVSARTGEGVEKMFQQSAELLLKSIRDGTMDPALFQRQGSGKPSFLVAAQINPAKVSYKKTSCC